MRLTPFKRREVEEAVTVSPPTQDNVGRVGYVTGIPIGGATVTNPASTTAGMVDRVDYLNSLNQAYHACPHASAAVDVIARTITAGGITAVPNSHSLNDAKIPDPPKQVQDVLNLFAWVNPEDDMRQLMRNVITDLLIFGDSYTEVVWILNKPVAMYYLAPQTMTIQSDPHGIITGFHQQLENGTEANFEPHEVIHVKLDSAGGGLYGVSPTMKNILPITVWTYTEALIKETMRRGDPLQAWIDWPIALPESEMKRFQQWYQIRNMGPQNIGNLVETKGGAELHELRPHQLAQWMDVKQQARDEIYTGYGVPPSKVAVIEAGNIGGGTGTAQDRSFTINTCGPLGEIVLEKFTSALLQRAYKVFDWHLQFGVVDWRDDQIMDQIADLRVRGARWTINKSRSVIGEPPIPGGDKAFIVDRQSMVLVEDLDDYSKAAVRASDAKNPMPAGGEPPVTPAGGAPAPPQLPDPTAVPPNSGGGGGESEEWQPGSEVFYSRSLWGPDQHNQVLEAAWRSRYNDKRKQLLEEHKS